MHTKEHTTLITPEILKDKEEAKHLKGQSGPPVGDEKVCVCNVFAYSRSALRPKLICWDKNEVFGKQIV